jgi:hypothetical protein
MYPAKTTTLIASNICEHKTGTERQCLECSKHFDAPKQLNQNSIRNNKES